MNLNAIAGLICGIGIFLFSVVQMSEVMNKAAGEKSERLLSKFGTNRAAGVFAGAGITAAVQSSAAVTVSAISLADCGKLSLSACTGIIMGSNIGTTVTGVLAALKFSFAAPFFLLVGAFAMLVTKSEKVKNTACFLCALGLLFVGIDTMKESAAKLNESGLLTKLFLSFTSPLSAVVFGFLSTAAAQSSSATVGVLQSLVSVGAISRESAVFMICGQNIGATVPTLLSAVKAKKTAKSAALFHLIFNLIGTSGVFLLSLFVSPAAIFESIENGESFVCAVHVMFNVLCTVVVFPLSLPLARLSEKTVASFSRVKKSFSAGREY